MIDAPADPISERAVIGHLLYNQAANLAVPLLPEHFADPIHGRVYEAALRLRGTVRFLPAAVAGDLAAELEPLGGLTYIGMLMDMPATHTGAAAVFAMLWSRHGTGGSSLDSRCISGAGVRDSDGRYRRCAQQAGRRAAGVSCGKAAQLDAFA